MAEFVAPVALGDSDVIRDIVDAESKSDSLLVENDFPYVRRNFNNDGSVAVFLRFKCYDVLQVAEIVFNQFAD